jgi:predicted nucleotidyltransferase component of viral defense system
MADFLHNHKSFKDLLLILEAEKGIVPGLLEKDYWIMHVLFGLKNAGLSFELKGGTSLSKGLGIIKRFSEDIDIRINPPAELKVNETGAKPNAVKSRFGFYDWLATNLEIDGIVKVERDHEFDSTNGMSGGIRLYYNPVTDIVEDLKPGILLEAGFDQVTPNKPADISSWALDKAKATSNIPFIDNVAREIPCYDMRYTFVEKLQTIVTKFRQEMADGKERKNYMRQYYDVYCLLQKKAVQEFLGTNEYLTHKDKRFPKIDKSTEIQHNEAFLLSSDETRSAFRERYHATSSLYFQGQPDFDKVIEGIRKYLPMM